MNKKSFITMMLALVAITGLAKTKTAEVKADSLLLFVQAGDSCMQQYNTFEALKYYQEAYAIAKKRSQHLTVEQPNLPLDKFDELPEEKQDEIIKHLKRSAENSSIVDCMVQMKLANCHYKRGNYRETADLLKLVPEDSLSHEAFRQLCFSYQKQGDNDSFIYWASQMVYIYPMDGEVVANLILANIKAQQPQGGIIHGLRYSQRDSTNILVNRALADAWFVNRDFTAAAKLYNRLLEQGDSTFNTLYSAGMCYSQIEDLEQAYHYLKLAFLISGMQHYGCAYRLGVVCIDTKRYPEGLGYLDLAKQLMRPDTTIMKAITLSQGEGYYLTQHYPEAVEAWKRHLDYNPGSVATYYNIANAYAYLLKDDQQAKSYYQQFTEKAREVENPTPQLTEMMEKAQEMLQFYNKFGAKAKPKPSPQKPTGK